MVAGVTGRLGATVVGSVVAGAVDEGADDAAADEDRVVFAGGDGSVAAVGCEPAPDGVAAASLDGPALEVVAPPATADELAGPSLPPLLGPGRVAPARRWSVAADRRRAAAPARRPARRKRLPG